MEKQYDVFLSWTNADRSIKSRFKQMLLDTTFKGRKLAVFDSGDASAIVGYYPSERVDKVSESKVYVLFLQAQLANAQRSVTFSVQDSPRRIYPT